MKTRSKQDASGPPRGEDDTRPCASAEQCHRRSHHVTGFADPRWETSFVRWCPLCKRFVSNRPA
jgi:hypothetical protein